MTEAVTVPDPVGVSLSVPETVPDTDGVPEGVPEGVLDGVSDAVWVTEDVTVTDPDGVPLSVPETVAETDVVGVWVGEDDALAPSVVEADGVPDREGERLGVEVGEGEAEGGANAYSMALSAKTTVLPASIGELVMGCAVGVVKFHCRLPEELRAIMEPPEVPTSVVEEKCEGVVAPSKLPVLYVHTNCPLVKFFTITALPAVM